jgi:hypothetical protein
VPTTSHYRCASTDNASASRHQPKAVVPCIQSDPLGGMIGGGRDAGLVKQARENMAGHYRDTGQRHSI